MLRTEGEKRNLSDADCVPISTLLVVYTAEPLPCGTVGAIGDYFCATPTAAPLDTDTDMSRTRARPHVSEEAVEHADGDSEVQAHEPGARDGRPRPPRYKKSQAPQRPPILDRRQPAKT